MTEAQREEIERELEIRLPAEYCAATQGESAVVLFQEPGKIIAATRSLSEEGRYLAIGESAAGDLYLVDLSRDPSPVYSRGRVDNALTEEWPDLTTFVADWRQLEEKSVADRVVWQKEGRANQKHWRLFALFLGAFILLVALTIASSHR